MNNNEKKLHTEKYIHLRDTIIDNGKVDDIGRLEVHDTCTSTHKMTYVRKHGHPDLFITFTCNSSWPEIKKDAIYG
ncbi:hypothetical protein J437_LFUL009935 [Ladona fulva]|uniref:Helitron helicase-like domain-containing protein n=1 Tax=Ladona fulva TaxID=123851 RepID=A0A8K0P4E0_LADFU|nr:hypothetical protein J437_LFUL009935 [Ladona fulva]